MESQIPKMNAESGFEVMESGVAPLRESGYVTLLSACLSAVGLVYQPMVVFSLIAVIMGAFALRKYNGLTPLGLKPARVGICLAIALGSCSFFAPWFKSAILTHQAEKFALIYLDVIAMDETEFAMELNKDYVNRMDPTMSLEEHYQGAPQARENYENFRSGGVNEMIRERGPGAEWAFHKPTRLYTEYRVQRAELVIVDPTGSPNARIRMVMDYRVDSKGQGQWHVSNVQTYSVKRYIAPTVL